MANRKNIEALESIIAETLDLDSVTLTMDTVADDVDGWDSMAHVRIIIAVEESLGVRFTTNEVSSLKSVGDLVRTIEAKQAV